MRLISSQCVSNAVI